MNKASCLNLLSNAVVLWNTLRMERIVTQLRSDGLAIADDHLAHVWPLQRRQVELSSVYFVNRIIRAFTLPEPVEACPSGAPKPRGPIFGGVNMACNALPYIPAKLLETPQILKP